MASSSRIDDSDTDDICEHSETVVDCRSGDTICTSCGTIVGDRDLVDFEELNTLRDETANVNHSTLMMGSSYRSLQNAYREINGMADRIFLVKSISDRAKAIFQQVYDRKLLTGHNHLAIASACLYLSCWEQKVPRAYHEISMASKVEKEKYSGCVECIKKELKLQLDPIKPADFIPRFCSKLDLPFKIQRVTTHVAQRTMELGLASGRSVLTISATAIYFASVASGIKLTSKMKEQIGLVAGVKATNTIGDCYELMLPRVTEIFPLDFEFVTPIQQLPPK